MGIIRLDPMRQIIKYLKMTILGIILLSGTFAFGLVLFFNFAPQIGEKSTGERLERVLSSKNYRNGFFVNTLPTELGNPFKVMRKVGREFFFSDNNREPEMQIKNLTYG